MKRLFLWISFLPLIPASGATVYSIDINDADASTTAADWTGLDATHTGNGGSITIGSINFSIGSSDGARLRGTVPAPKPNPLTADLAFDDGAGKALVFFFGGAGDLPAGDWKVEACIYDSGVGDLGNIIVGFRDDGTENEVSNSVAPNATDAAITFTSDGTIRIRPLCPGKQCWKSLTLKRSPPDFHPRARNCLTGTSGTPSPQAINFSSKNFVQRPGTISSAFFLVPCRWPPNLASFIARNICRSHPPRPVA
ncbi:MAG: hypothetical protein QNL33_13595 [Akkermansiaceae bacterium]